MALKIKDLNFLSSCKVQRSLCSYVWEIVNAYRLLLCVFLSVVVF